MKIKRRYPNDRKPCSLAGSIIPVNCRDRHRVIRDFYKLLDVWDALCVLDRRELMSYLTKEPKWGGLGWTLGYAQKLLKYVEAYLETHAPPAMEKMRLKLLRAAFHQYAVSMGFKRGYMGKDRMSLGMKSLELMSKLTGADKADKVSEFAELERALEAYEADQSGVPSLGDAEHHSDPRRASNGK